ncbi:uncharacterized protein [Miscanthus floridulus]|uniref:uncharacterized protein n=1 Tax=Miscanthus floridulus TaxID=154761 RepID=UPI00345831A0
MSLSTASILLHAFLLTTLLLATSISIPVEHGDVNTTTTFTNSSATSSPDDKENFEMYFCFLCSGRDPLLIHHCPIYWDECHLICDDDMSTSTTVDAAVPMATAPPAPPVSSPLGSSSAHPMVQGDDCYVMKLYMSGRYVIVEHRPCKYIAWCFLTCGGGELADRRKVVMGGTTTTMPATIQGSFLPVELCGTQTQVNAPWAPPSAGVVVPAGGAH